VRSGKRAAVVTHSKKTANQIYHGISEMFPKKKVKIYTGDTPAETKRDDFRDVNETWKEADVIIYNSTCEAGISCTLAEIEDVYAFFDPEIVCVQASYQMVGRIRAMKRLHCHISRPKNSITTTSALPTTKEEVFEQYRCHICYHIP
jgi:hypothetical protein